MQTRVLLEFKIFSPCSVIVAKEKSRRLFIAVNIPEQAKKEIGLFLEAIPKQGWGKVRQENLHLTLAFLGWGNEKQEKKAVKAMESLQGFGEFETELSGFGHFEGRVIWIGSGKGAEEMSTLSKKLNDALGTKDESFHSHITLARNKGAKKQEAKDIVEKLRKTMYKRTIAVKSIELMESVLHSSGPEYKKVFSVALEN